MISSMTGFARREASGEFGTLSCELRSVNHRYLEAALRLPEELRGLEPDLRSQLGQQLKRGKVDCSVQWRASQGTALALNIDAVALQRVIAQARNVAAALPEGANIDAMEILRWPGVVKEDQTDPEGLRAALRELFTATLGELCGMRAREGVRLRDMILQRCAAMEQLVAQVRARLPEVHSRTRARLHERVAELAAAVDASRLEQELALLLQRLDVAEELDRLGGHLEEIRRVVDADEGAGRRLDFLMQELNREANTLSSKSQDLETTRAAVEMKVCIEQMREQVQNIE
jgi:uncharacterized protein (TIGR00255 family)